jgi:glutamyl-tRNA synthetase
MSKEIADLIFPEVINDIESLYKKYPPRDLAEGVKVTRFAPSPTGFLHIGGLFTAVVAARVAHASGGIFFLRIEDTDKKREVENAVLGLTRDLVRFGTRIDEGVVSDELHTVGAYGPYVQSERKDIYQTCAKALLATGKAYPCFCTAEELEETRKEQEELKIRPGYYEKWAKHRNISDEEIKENLSQGKPFVIRFRSEGNFANQYKFKDDIKGEVTVSENDQDIVILKSDGLPTYHFAHVVDDHLMGTTHVLRGDEWLSSLSIHLQLLRAFAWSAPKYGHLSPILKLEDGNRRKLSKRKDPEAAVEYYLKEGYPNEAVVEYLLNIADSDFEEWRKKNPEMPNEEFEIKLNRLSKSGALFDINKLLHVSKEVISRMTAAQVYELSLTWAGFYDEDLAKRMIEEKDYFINIFGIERNGLKPRKDFGKWSDVKGSISFFFDDWFADETVFQNGSYPETVKTEDIKNILTAYAARYINNLKAATKEEWFADLKAFAEENGFAGDMKEFKANPEKYQGTVGDIAMILRVALTHRTQAPDLYEMIKVFGDERFVKRIKNAAADLN